MKKFLLLLIFTLLFLNPTAGSGDINIPIKKVFSKDWLEQNTLKYGMVYSLCLSQFATGLTEGYHFNGNGGYVVNKKNYHMFEVVRRVGWMSTGFLLQANIRNKKVSWFTKTRRVVGSILISRLAFETAYRWQRYNNPFENDPIKNKHAIVYFGIRNGKLTDLYIGTGKVTTPLADIGILILGMVIFK